MKTRIAVVLLATAIVMAMGIAYAGQGNGMPSGPHYNLNILASRNEDLEVGPSMGHTMFVRFDAHTKIYMTQADDGQFVVTDRNGLDGVAAFNIAPGHYEVYARALGKPGPGGVTITSYGEFEDDEGTKLMYLDDVDLTRIKGKPETKNISKLFYVTVTLCLEYDETTGTCLNEVTYNNEWVFDIDELIEYYWDYYNIDVKLLQVRFYPVD